MDQLPSDIVNIVYRLLLDDRYKALRVQYREKWLNPMFSAKQWDDDNECFGDEIIVFFTERGMTSREIYLSRVPYDWLTYWDVNTMCFRRCNNFVANYRSARRSCPGHVQITMFRWPNDMTHLWLPHNYWYSNDSQHNCEHCLEGNFESWV